MKISRLKDADVLKGKCLAFDIGETSRGVAFPDKKCKSMNSSCLIFNFEASFVLFRASSGWKIWESSSRRSIFP
jgi:hypothetical protein